VPPGKAAKQLKLHPVLRKLSDSILGASGNIAKHVINILVQKDDINLTLFLRHKSRLGNKHVSKCRIVEGDVLDYDQLKEAIAEQDVVYANLAGELEAMAKQIVRAMDEARVKKLGNKKQRLAALSGAE
jgi:putative NADH-flavin reductase